MESRHIENTSEQLPVREKQKATEAGIYEGRWFEPRVDIYETSDALTVVADIPGALPEDISTDVRDNLLTLTARVRTESSAFRPVYQEYRAGHFSRQFRLGQQIDRSKITAQLKDGVLTLRLPKADSAKPRRIEVQIA